MKTYCFKWNMMGTSEVQADTKNQANKLFRETYGPPKSLADCHKVLEFKMLLHALEVKPEAAGTDYVKMTEPQEQAEAWALTHY